MVKVVETAEPFLRTHSFSEDSRRNRGNLTYRHAPGNNTLTPQKPRIYWGFVVYFTLCSEATGIGV